MKAIITTLILFAFFSFAYADEIIRPIPIPSLQPVQPIQMFPQLINEHINQNNTGTTVTQVGVIQRVEYVSQGTDDLNTAINIFAENELLCVLSFDATTRAEGLALFQTLRNLKKGDPKQITCSNKNVRSPSQTVVCRQRKHTNGSDRTCFGTQFQGYVSIVDLVQ